MKRVRHFWPEIAVVGLVLVVAATAALARPPERRALPTPELRSNAPSYPEVAIRTGGLLP